MNCKIKNIKLSKPLSKYIDHTLLKPEATSEDIIKICNEAKEYDFASVCVNSCYAKLVSEELAGTDVKTCCVIGFPLGAMDRSSKVFEASQAISNGAKEIDMVINVGMLKAGEDKKVLEDIKAVADVCHKKVSADHFSETTKDQTAMINNIGDDENHVILKVIIETCLLTDEEKKKACLLSKQAGADFVKTSTGFSKGGATIEDIRLMRETVGNDTRIKAAGGIRDLETALCMIEAGADRIGASAGIKIIKETDN